MSELAVPSNNPAPAQSQHYQVLNQNFNAALKTVDDIVLKNYLSKLENMEIVPIPDEVLAENSLSKISLFKINEMVYEKDEYATNKFASVFNALSCLKCGVFIIMDSDGKKTDFYMGVNIADSAKDIDTLDKTLKNALLGQFPGIRYKSYQKESEMGAILERIPSGHISAVSCVANIKDSNTRENKSFIQGLEKLALAMQGKAFTGIILANSTTQDQLNEIRRGYEAIYSQLAPFARSQVTYVSSNSMSVSQSTALGKSVSSAISKNYSRSQTLGTTTSESVTKQNTASKVASGLATATSIVGMALSPFTGGTSLAVGAIASSALSAGAAMLQAQETKGTTQQETVAETTGEGRVDTTGKSETRTDSQGTTVGTGENLTISTENKTIIDILDRLDKQLRRLDEFESLGMWECAAYFLSSTGNKTNAEIAAATYKALMSGENSGLEASAINSWHDYDETVGQQKTELISAYLHRLSHPIFTYCAAGQNIEVSPCSMVSGNELALHMGLPRHSVCGLPVVEHASFGKEVNFADANTSTESIRLGSVMDMGRPTGTEVRLDKERFSMHTFITGSTGSGKSNTVYKIIEKLSLQNVSFMIVEPAKGEYKNIFGNNEKYRAKVFGTNPVCSDLLKINPFRFPSGIHVLEHVDRLIEIFNVCWPMYAAMPAVLKDAVLQSYQVCGWDLIDSTNSISPDLFPTFQDLQNELFKVIESSAYSQEVKSNYMGSLATRVKSLANGLNGQIFSSNEIDNTILFDKNVIIDLSRVGSLETKSLIMGVLVMRLNEHRMSNAKGMNSPLKHVTVLEEAHNILKRTSGEQNPESPSVAGKSVEMLSNAIAEMRTYGEGFIIADQSPSAVDISAIRNTNTKIIMRLPDEADRRLAGRAAALKDDQLDEIAKLPKGVAVVYQNDWLEPVLCKVDHFTDPEKKYEFTPSSRDNQCNDVLFRSELLKLLLKGRLAEPGKVDIDVTELKYSLPYASVSTRNKIGISQLIREYESSGKLRIWEDAYFGDLSGLVVELMECKPKVTNLVQNALNFDELTQRLRELIDDGTKGISNDLAISISQCFMKDYSTGSPDDVSVYAAWRESIVKKEVC